jgi:hypothetical protein
MSVFANFDDEIARDWEEREAAEVRERGNGPKHDVSPPPISEVGRERRFRGDGA